MQHDPGCRSVVRGWMLAAVLALPSVALAQTVEGGSAARAAFERGIAAVEREQFADAASAFEASYRLRAVPVVLFNLAGAYDRMGRARDAQETYTRYLREVEPTVSAERVRFVREALTRLRASLATMEVVVSPPGAVVTVDGRDAAVSADGLRLDPGEHVFAVSSEGHVTHRETRLLRPGERSVLRVSLSRQEAALPASVVVPPRTGTAGPEVDARVRSVPADTVSDGEGVTRQWWFWTGVGVATVGATMAVLGVLGVFNTQPPPPMGLDYGVNALMAR